MNSGLRLGLATFAACVLSAVPVAALVDRQTWVGTVVVGVAAIVAVGVLARRRGAPLALTAALQLLVLAEWLVIRFAGATAALGVLPTPAAWATLVETARQGFDVIARYAAPAPALPGIAVLIAGGIGLVAVVVDALVGAGGHASARAAWAGLPLVAPYALTVALLPDGIGIPTFCLVVLGWLTLVVTDSRVRVACWGRPVTIDPRRHTEPQTSALARGGLRIGAFALVVAVLVPLGLPVLPEGLFAGIGGPGRGAGQTIRTSNPIVDLRRDLVRPDNVELFRYRSTDPSPEYIRTVSLDVFDGTVWRLSNREVPRSQRVEEGLAAVPGLASSVEARTVEQQVSVSATYESKWLPLPYPARQVVVDGDWRYDRRTLDVVSTGDDTRGVSYEVSSLALAPTAADLRAAARDLRAVQPLLDLPENLPPSVTALAKEVTVGATDGLSRAYALQEWFRGSGGFVYTLTRAPGNSSSDLEQFLTDRRGYCEQFAAAMAVMARTLRIPARVAVGFTPGTRNDDGTWVVRAHDAHAWPELYLGRVGWVRFEPTPAVRTGAPPDWSVQSATAGQAQPSLPAPAASQAPGAARPDPQTDPGAANGNTQTSLLAQVPWRLVIVVVAVLGVLAMPAAAAAVRRRRRWAGARADAAAQAEVAWDELREASQDAGLAWDPALTPRGVRRRLSSDVELDERAQQSLGRVVTVAEQARYAAAELAVTGAPSLRRDAAGLRGALLRGRPRRVRWRARWWPSAITDLWRRRS